MRVALSALVSFVLLLGLPARAGTSGLPVTTISIDTVRGHADFKVEVANDQASQEKGLMFRRKLATNAGMLFDFHQTVMTSFWMKNTILPLDIIFVRMDGTISSVAANAVPYSEAAIPSTEPIRAVLEINAGRAAALAIRPGDKVHAAIFRTAR